MPDNASLNALVEQYAGLEGEDLISRVVADHPGRVVLLSSFGAESAVLLHMVSRVASNLPVLFLDTGKLFAETHAYRQTLARTLGLTNIIDVMPDAAELTDSDPEGRLHETSKDYCCHIRKTLPMQRFLRDYDFVISGRKRFHGGARSELSFVSLQDGKVKIEPLAAYTPLDLKTYATVHDLPRHPLLSAGYRSIGCQPCTIAGGTDDDPRSGRWAGTDKTECGIHITPSGQVIRQIESTADLA